MSEIFRFPKGGYEVIVYRRKDIIDSLKVDDTTKELLDVIINQCEKDAETFLKEDKWTGIPYLGNMRVPESKQKFKEINGVELLAEAKNTLDEDKYDAFKKDLNANIGKSVAREKLYKYRTSMFVTKHRWQYNKYIKDRRANKCVDKNVFARLMCFSCIELTNYIPEE